MSWLKSQLQRVSRSPSPAPKISQSSVLETTRTVCTLVSNLGSGALNVPGLQAAGLIGCQIIDIIQKMKDNQDAYNELVDDIGQLMSPINLRLQGCETADVDDELKADIKRLEESLQKVRETLQYEAGRGRLDRTLNAGRNSGEIAKCKAIVNRQFIIFQNSSLMSLRMGMASLKRQADGARPGDQDANGQIVKSASPFPSQPAPPEDFFGRSDLILTLANLFIGNDQRRIAILGAGGLGKTSIALHLIHHEIVVQRFQGREFFVGCDGITSADGLASRILQILEASASASGNIINALHAALAGALPTLLVLDNFETTWDTQGDHNAVRELLKKIASVKSVSVIITMRATYPPTEIQWSWSETIPVLSPASAKDAFLATHGPLSSGSNSDDEVLDELLKELDYVPLAIHLLAQVSRGFKPPFMLKRWREKKTQMLRVETGARALDRLESVDVSISLSMESLHVDRNPEAIQLLGMLCLLPDGLLGWQERLEVIEKTFETATTNLFLLRKFALVYTAGDKLGVLSPIRHYILHHHPPDSQHTQCIYNIIWELVNTYALVSFGPEFRGAVDALSPEMANIGSLIDHAAAYDPGEIVVDIAIQISWHLCLTRPSRHLLQKVSTLVPSVHTKTQARYWRVSSEIMYGQDEYIEAESALKQAQGLFLEIEDRLGAAQCSQRLGDTLEMQSNYSEAAIILTDARSQFHEIGNRLGAAQSSLGLGNILTMQSKHSEAAIILTDARDQFIEIGEGLGAAQCSQSLGKILSEQSNYSEATVILTDARTQFIEIGERMGAAQCSSTLGEILSSQGNYSEATAILTDVRAQFIEIGERLGAAQCSKSLVPRRPLIVVQRFQGREFFVGCDGVTSADGLASRILQILEVPASASGNIINALHAALAGALPTLIVLDNFETPWDAEGDHNAVRELLKKIASVKSVSVIITMRTTDPPTEIRWSWSKTIPALSPTSAKDLYLAIHGPLPSGSNSDDEVLDELLKELDYVPLAINLLAQVSRDSKPPVMLKRWQERKTQMLRVETGARTQDRLESLDVSISLSMESLHVDRNPEAIQLLGMLCLLPDGLLGREERLEVIEKTFKTATSDLSLLRKLALVYTAGDKLGVLSPIRHYVLRHHPPDSQHAQCIYNIIWELVNTYAPVDFGPEFNGAVEALSPEMGNIGSLIDHAIAHNHPRETIVDIAIEASWHLYRTHPSRHLLQKASTLVPVVQAKTQAEYFRVSGNLLYKRSIYVEAASALTQARSLFLEIEDCLGVAQCSQSLGDILRMQSEYAEATAILTNARAQFIEIGEPLGAAQCSLILGNILMTQGEYAEATAILRDARAQFIEIGERIEQLP
ncbi:hypothetical protein FIBSPDRAFT_1038827 [Athelia psychrophila]|uniref:Novel STAND NTPase 1 domain-containing protein n=1 Tax=Athelia psychrophila TaxID=1759441 RepID=A0A166SH89_9AGAM|nr:hypothetical protein FIBSPDRAFT_1038827 [Fibularhizoctonia sp. CBS 109695]